MRRAVKVTLGFATKSKQHQIAALLEAYRAAVSFFIHSLWVDHGKLNGETLARLGKDQVRLSERYKSQALKQALETVISTKKAAKVQRHGAGIPAFNGPAVLDAKFATLEEGEKSFDLIVKLSTLKKRHRITIPTRRTKVLNKWLDRPGAILIQGCSLTERNLTLFVEIPDREPKTQGDVLGIDLGVNKLISTSDGDHLGTTFKAVRDKINRRVPGSLSRKRAYQERDNLINRTVNQLPWSRLKVIGVEDLHDMKRGKKPNRGRTFRKALAPWTYRQVLTRIDQKAQENRVRLVRVDPRNTSRTCPICDMVSKDSRRGEDFVCVRCGYKADADHVGAQNVLAGTFRLLGSVESPRLSKGMDD